MKDVILVPVHGMGETKSNFADGLRRRLQDELGPDWSRVEFAPVFYQDVLQPNQSRVMKAMKREDIDWLRLREFVLYGFSDAAGLEHAAGRPGSAYEQVQDIIMNTLASAYWSAGGAKPVVLVAQSLGCQVMSNYIWDAQSSSASYGVWDTDRYDVASDDPALKDFLKLKSLRYFVTTGCNIPIFVAGFDKADIKPIKTASNGYRFDWYNYYDADDVLGWPLRRLNDAYSRAVDKDIEVNADKNLIDRITKSWNPFSHTGYWEDGSVTRAIGRRLREFLG